MDKNCCRCRLSKTRHCIVTGRGDIPCTILLIGEAPGKSEDLVGQPFVGASGKLLDMMLHDAEGIADETVRIINTVFCRPTETTGGENRDPQPDEIEACWPNVEKAIRQADPYVVVFVGKIAQHACQTKVKKMGYKKQVFMLHPAYVLRNGGKGSPFYLSCVRALDLAVELSQQTGGESL